MTLKDLEPDALIRERVFQRIVDGQHLDPEKAAKTSYRLHLIGMVVRLALMSACAMLPASTTGMAQSQPFVLMGLLMADSGFMGLIISSRPHHGMNPGIAVLRVAATIIAVGLLMNAVHVWIAVQHQITVVCTTVIALAWAFGPSACYLHLCRRPPPRRPRQSTARRISANA